MIVQAGRTLARCALATLLAGCAPSAEVSGWEMAPKRSRDAQAESFPDIPVVLPATATATATALPAGGQASSMRATYLKRLDEGSLFRRGYSVPTP